MITGKNKNVVVDTDSTKHPGWVSWCAGWGWSLKLANGLECTVSKGMVKGDGFSFTVFGLKGKKQFEDSEEAKRSAEHNARMLLERAISNLPNN